MSGGPTLQQLRREAARFGLHFEPLPPPRYQRRPWVLGRAARWGWVYALADDGCVSYVGMTLGFVRGRVRAHAKAGRHFSEVLISEPMDDDRVRWVEKILIARLAPPINVRFTPRSPPGRRFCAQLEMVGLTSPRATADAEVVP